MAALIIAAEFPARHRHDAPMPVFGRSVGLSEPVLDAQSASLSGPDGTGPDSGRFLTWFVLLLRVRRSANT